MNITKEQLTADIAAYLSIEQIARKYEINSGTLRYRLKSLRITEKEYAEQKGYSKVWGKEKYKFVKRLV
jgi:transposase-like protein